MNPCTFEPAVLHVLRRRSASVLALGASVLLWVAASVAQEPAGAPTSAAGSSAVSASTSEATSSSHKFELTYTAPPDCPSRQDFVTWTNEFYVDADATTPAGSDADWQARSDELAGSIQVRVLEEGAQYTAHLMMVHAGGQCPTVRPPHTETACGDAVRAMAYSLAQALRAPACAEVSSVAPSCPPSPSPGAKPVRPCPPLPPLPPGEPLLRGEVGVAAGLVAPLAEDIAWGGALLVGFTTPAGNRSARVAMGYWDAGRVPIGHDLRAQLWSLSVSVCPFAIPFTRWLTLPLCVTGELGPVALSGVGAADATAADEAAGRDHANLYLWSSLGAAARLRLSNDWLFAELEPNLIFPLFRHPVYVHEAARDPSERQDAGEVGQWVALKAHLNVGLVFP